MKVWVIMGNDYPDAVIGSEEEAKDYIDKKKKEDIQKREKAMPGYGPRIYWRSYEFDLIEKEADKQNEKELKEGLRGLLSEWDKFTRYGSPIAKAANERITAAHKLIEEKKQ